MIQDDLRSWLEGFFGNIYVHETGTDICFGIYIDFIF